MLSVMNSGARASQVVWSATPTPFLTDLSVDQASVRALVEHHLRLGVSGLMLGGTCGEGPWMPYADLQELTAAAAEASAGRIRIAAQVTDNSARRMLANIEGLARAGAEFGVIASPYLMMNVNPRRVLDLYLEVVRSSPIPIGFYDRGKNAAYVVETELLPELLAEPNLQIVKDSSTDPVRRDVFLQAARSREGLTVLNGDEFHCLGYLQAGYNGLLLGGGIFNGGMALGMIRSVAQGDPDGAARIQERMNDLMFRVYGGEKITCWLTGLKYLLQRMGIFQSTAGYLGYPLTDSCRAAIDEIVDGADVDGFRSEIFPVVRDPA